MNMLLALLVLAGASAYAQNYSDGNWQFTVSNGEATIISYNGNEEL